MCTEIAIAGRLQESRNRISCRTRFATVGQQELVYSRLSQSDRPVPAGMPLRIRLSMRLAMCGVPQLLHGPVGGLALGHVLGIRDTAMSVCGGERLWRMLHGSYRRRKRVYCIALYLGRSSHTTPTGFLTLCQHHRMGSPIPSTASSRYAARPHRYGPPSDALPTIRQHRSHGRKRASGHGLTAAITHASRIVSSTGTTPESETFMTRSTEKQDGFNRSQLVRATVEALDAELYHLALLTKAFHSHSDE